MSLRLVLGIAILAVALGAPVAWWIDRTEVTCGIVVAIDQASITDVRGFSLRTPEGITSAFRVDPARLAPDSFVPGHLREHRALATPVCVTFRSIESPAVALDLRDGPLPTSPAASVTAVASEAASTSPGSGTGPPASSNDSSSPVAFHSPRYGYALAVPAGFTASEMPGSGGIHPGEPGVDTFDDGHGTRLYVIRFPVAAGTTLASWVSPVTSHLTDGHGLTAEATDDIAIGGRPARLATYHLRIPPYVTLYLEAEVVDGSAGFAFGLESTTGRDADARALLDAVVRTVTFDG